MSKNNVDPSFFRRELATAGASVGMMVTGLLGMVAATEDLREAYQLRRDRADVRYDAPNEAAIRAGLAEKADVAEKRGYTNGSSGLGILATGGLVLYRSGQRWREAFPKPVPELYSVPLTILGVQIQVEISTAFRPTAGD